jgi:hypothetical protein
MTFSCVSLQSSPRMAWASQWGRALVSSTMPISNPRPLICLMRGLLICLSFAMKYSPIANDRFTKLLT